VAQVLNQGSRTSQIFRDRPVFQKLFNLSNFKECSGFFEKKLSLKAGNVPVFLPKSPGSHVLNC
jgi:hypothetical protein